MKTQKLKILIADDSDLIRDRLKNSFHSIENVDVIGEAINGFEALQLIKDKIPDFVTLDIRMPQMSGIKVLEKLKELSINSTICIFTNHPYPQYKQKCMAEGADFFFEKNQDFGKLINLVKNLSNSQSEILIV